MNIKGNIRLNTTAEGFRDKARRLALVIESIARSWLYLFNSIVYCVLCIV